MCGQTLLFIVIANGAIERIRLPIPIPIVTVALSRVVSEIFNVKNLDLEIPHQRSLKVIESGVIP